MLLSLSWEKITHSITLYICFVLYSFIIINNTYNYIWICYLDFINGTLCIYIDVNRYDSYILSSIQRDLLSYLYFLKVLWILVKNIFTVYFFIFGKCCSSIIFHFTLNIGVQFLFIDDSSWIVLWWFADVIRLICFSLR